MSIFEQIGGKISSAGQETATKAKKFAESTKLNGSIGDCEKQISQLYFEIGKAYCEKHMHDDLAEEQELIDKVRNLKEEIVQYREQLRKLKGILCCDACGAEIANGAAFCNVCGNKIMQIDTSADTPENTSMEQGCRCSKCNAQMDADAIFCIVCGTKITK